MMSIIWRLCSCLRVKPNLFPKMTELWSYMCRELFKIAYLSNTHLILDELVRLVLLDYESEVGWEKKQLK